MISDEILPVGRVWSGFDVIVRDSKGPIWIHNPVILPV